MAVCNSCVIVSSVAGLLAAQIFDNRSPFHAVQSPINSLVLGVSVARNHCQSTVTRAISKINWMGSSAATKTERRWSPPCGPGWRSRPSSKTQRPDRDGLSHQEWNLIKVAIVNAGLDHVVNNITGKHFT